MLTRMRQSIPHILDSVSNNVESLRACVVVRAGCNDLTKIKGSAASTIAELVTTGNVIAARMKSKVDLIESRTMQDKHSIGQETGQVILFPKDFKVLICGSINANLQLI